MTEYLVTDCVLHGVKVTSDRASARTYSRMAWQCVDDLQHHLNGGEGKGVSQAEEDHKREDHPDTDCWVCCHLMEVTQYPDEIGDINVSTAGDGHMYTFEVVGFWPDGTSRHGAAIEHQDECGCNDPESWY